MFPNFDLKVWRGIPPQFLAIEVLSLTPQPSLSLPSSSIASKFHQ
jgi:hypothetical protein